MTFATVAVIGGVAALGGAYMQSQAAGSAADTQANAANNASVGQMQMYQQTRTDLAPWMQQGQMALNQLGAGTATAESSLLKPFSMQDFQQSPAYQFNLEQGQQAINKGANARGNYYAPQTLQDLGKFSQGMASNEFQNAFQNYNTSQSNTFNRLYGLSGAGQNAAAGIGGFGAGAQGQIGQNTIGAGNAQAAGQIGQANAYTGGLQNLYNSYLMNRVLSGQQQGTGDIGYGASPWQ